jgi:AraC family transcriptional regulator
MADGNLASSARDLPPKVTRIATAALNGFTASLVRTSAGVYDDGVWPEHRVILHSGREPVGADCRCDDMRLRRLQVFGDFDVQPAGAPGRWEDDGPAEVMVFRIAPAFLRTTAEGLEMASDRAELIPRLQARDDQVEHIALAFKAEMQSGDPLSRLYGESLAMALASRLLQRYGAPAKPTAHGLSRRQQRRVFDHVETYLDTDLSLAELAGVAGVSVSHFTVLFRRSVGMSVHRYVIQQRVMRARAMLLEGSLSIAQVALETGFAHQSHLARCMRRIVGLTPAEVARCR